ncbi:hypothetical protein [Kitasatospora sp. NPDC059673]|uniref:hypothetical protein n=1 Tax=Kitasatospora sp. NPDC059673 TaxID=3346901 RepID=UPI003675AA72
MNQPSVGATQAAGELAGALQAMLSSLVAKALGSQALTKDGQPLRQVCYMQMPNGTPINPKDFADPWSPVGTTTVAGAGSQAGIPPDVAAAVPPPGPVGPAVAAKKPPVPPPPTENPQLVQSLKAAFNTATLVDQRLMVTTDGSYLPFQGSEILSTAYEGLVMKAQGLSAPPPPKDVQDRIDKARQVLHKFDAKGNDTGKMSDAYMAYKDAAQKWADARSDFATAEAEAMTDPVKGQVWPVTSQSLQQKVDTAWDEWRAGGDADTIESALDTLESVGGSVGAFFVSQARTLYKAWNLGLTGVPVPSPYSEVMPSTWYDPNDRENGFTELDIAASQWDSSGATQSSQLANSWYQGHSQSVGGGGEAMVFGVTFGADATSTSSSDSAGSSASGGTSISFSNSTSDVEIHFEYGLCTIYRPWLLSELFLVDGWYLPGEPPKSISDGTIGGAVKAQDAQTQDQSAAEALPMITTQFMVVRNVVITASNWGDAGDRMSSWCQNASSSDQSSGTSVSGNVGYLGFGGEAHEGNVDWSGSESESAAASGSWWFDGNSQHGKLSINGCQIVGWIGEILPASPRVDGVNPPAVVGATDSTTSSTTTTPTAGG